MLTKKGLNFNVLKQRVQLLKFTTNYCLYQKRYKMLIKLKKKSDILPSNITPKAIYQSRRHFLASAATACAGLALETFAPAIAAPRDNNKIDGFQKSRWTEKTLGEKMTDYGSITKYNNFYEFGTAKTDPAKNSTDFESRPWSITIDGAVERPGIYDLDKFFKPHQLEERVYRFRCVEAWSMVVPWIGIPLANIIKRLGPTSNAKFVAFETLHDPERMPGQSSPVLKWPYREGLRIDEAMNELSILAVGLYGEILPNQNGAPVRLMVPWKYGFKSIKSIVKMTFQETQPPTSWNTSQSREYGFYSNVNPSVSHPRWSQSKERRIGDFLKRPTRIFNGYEEEVGHLYAGMDLRKFY
jgi:sulfoxide reductase catalytic subunit YedY